MPRGNPLLSKDVRLPANIHEWYFIRINLQRGPNSPFSQNDALVSHSRREVGNNVHPRREFGNNVYSHRELVSNDRLLLHLDRVAYLTIFAAAVNLITPPLPGGFTHPPGLTRPIFSLKRMFKKENT